MRSDDLTEAIAALDRCDMALVKLEKLCCEPGRSPRMSALAHTLKTARVKLSQFDNGSIGADNVRWELEDAGSQLGSLQIGCCAPSRMPLYADMLENLTDIQISVSRSAGAGH
jgi:hypothetical protein